MTRGIVEIEESLGNAGVRVKTQGELINKKNLGKSVLAGKDYKEGDVVKLADCFIRSPGIGLSPLNMRNLVKQPLLKEIKKAITFFLLVILMQTIKQSQIMTFWQLGFAGALS